MEKADFAAWMKAGQERFEKAADAFLPGASAFPPKLNEAVRWSIMGGGKRVRPLLCYAASEVTRAEPGSADAAALALECIHSYSLVHDDLPCMDNDMMRHDKASTHAKYGFAEALLAGDALQALAFRALASDALPPRTAVKLVAELSDAAGPRGMCGGQSVDLGLTGLRDKGVTLDELRRLHEMKTGALIRAAVLMGAMTGREELATEKLLRRLSIYGAMTGLAFQIIDDVLDAVGDSATLGKTAGKDETEGKPTYVSLLGVDGARGLAREAGAAARNALDEIESDPGYSGTTSRLAEILSFVLERDR